MIIEDSLCKICSRIDGVNGYRAFHMNHLCLLMKRYSEDSMKSIRLLNKPRGTNTYIVGQPIGKT